MKNSVLLIGLVCAFIAGMFFGPKRTEIKEVEKVVYKEKTDTQKRTVKREVRKPDGTVVTVTKTDTKKKTDTRIDQTIKNKRNWLLGVTYFPAIPVLDQPMGGAISVQYRAFGDVYAGLSYSTQNHVGLTLSVGF